MKTTLDNMETNEHDCADAILLMETEIYILYNIHVTGC